MQLIKWPMIAVLVCFMPSLASAQVCETRGRLEVCPQTAADGSRFYRVTPQRGALYGELMSFVNEGVDERQQISEQQIDDANTSKVIYYCPGTSLCTRGICRNGVSRLVNGDDVPRHIDTVCDGTGARASRGLVAGTAYRVPAHRTLTSTELVADATTTLDNNAHPLAGDVSRALGIGIEAGSDLVHAPSTLALAGLMQSVLNAQSRQVAVAAVEAPARMNHETPPVVATASAEATARIIRLESALALEQAVSSSRLVALWCMIGLLFIAIVALIWQHTAQKNKALGLKAEQIKALRSKRAAPVIVKKDEMREAWVTTPKFSLQYTAPNLGKVIAGYLRLSEVESGMTLVSGQRDGFEREAGRLRGVLAEEWANQSSNGGGDGVLRTQIEQIRDKLYAVWREEFGSILSLDEERQRVVDAIKVRDNFSTERILRKKTTLYELRGAILTDFLRVIHEGIGQATGAIDQLLGHASEEPLADEPTQFVANPLLSQPRREDEPTTRVNIRASEPEQGEEE